jgi:hypothetical protein
MKHRAVVAAGLQPRGRAAWLLLLVALSTSISAQTQIVRITSLTANVRSEASEKAPILQQVKRGAVLELREAQAEWFKVLLPPMSALGGARVEAFVSKKVAKLEAAPAGYVATPAPVPAAPVKATIDDQGLNVLIGAGSGAEPIEMVSARALRVADRLDTPSKLAASPGVTAVLARTDAGMTSPSSTAQMTYVWALRASSINHAISERRPSIIVSVGERAGLKATDVEPFLVKLAPASDGTAPNNWRLVSATRGPADAPVRAQADWTAARELKHDFVSTDPQATLGGITRLQLTKDLAPGDYAVVIKPRDDRQKFSGPHVLGDSPTVGRVFSGVWPFTVK